MDHIDFKHLTHSEPAVRGSYDRNTHTLRLFLLAPTSDSFESWTAKAWDLRKRATQIQNELIPSIWVANPSAPCLVTYPSVAIMFNEKISSYLPMVNVTVWRLSHFLTDREIAADAAAQATLFYQQNKKHPGKGDIPGYTGDIFVGYSSNGLANMAADLLGRFNAPDTATDPERTEQAKGITTTTSTAKKEESIQEHIRRFNRQRFNPW